jgi:caffeoyl-CoA O-methyltransferase
MTEQMIVRSSPSLLVSDLNALPDDGAFGVVIDGLDCDGLGEFAGIAWSHRSLLARRCVGVAAVVRDDELRERIASYAGVVPYPLTALADERDALGWIAGQHAAGVRGVRPAGGGRTVAMTPELDDYLVQHLNPGPDPVAADLAVRTTARFGDLAGMNIGEHQGRFLRLLVEVTEARNVVEVGTFTGMSALWLARGLAPGGRLTCFELDPGVIELARVAWAAAGVANRITVVIGPASEGLAALPDEPTIDLAFVDADKPGYAGYVDALLTRLAPGGLVLLDNTLWGGAVVHPSADDPSTLALRALNDELARRVDLEVMILPIGDGVTLVRRRDAP